MSGRRQLGTETDSGSPWRACSSAAPEYLHNHMHRRYKSCRAVRYGANKYIDQFQRLNSHGAESCYASAYRNRERLGVRYACKSSDIKASAVP